MAAIFQIRRGSNSTLTLADGELYLHEQSRSVYVGTDNTTKIQLAKLDEVNTGSFNVTGDITLGGNIYLGDNLANDSVNVNSPFSGSIVPSGSNVFDLGSNTFKYRNVYATSISGAIAATNGVISGSEQLASIFEKAASSTHTIVSGSSQIISILDSLNEFTSSQLIQNNNIGILSGSLIISASDAKIANDSQDVSITNLNSFSGSQLVQNINLAIVSSSLILTASNHNDRLNDLETNSTTSNIRLDNLETKSSSVDISLVEIHSYTSSLKNAITVTGVDTNSLTTIRGDFRVLGTSSIITSQHIHLDDNIIELNGTGETFGGFLVKDPTGISTVSGSLKWNANLDRWEAGKDEGDITSISKILLSGGDDIISSSLQLTDLNTFTQSINVKFNDLESITASLYTSASLMTSSIASLTASVIALQSFSGNVNVRFDNLQTYTTSVDGRFTTLATYTGSAETRFTEIATVSGSLIVTASNHEQRIDELENKSASVDTSITNINTFTESVNDRFTTLATYTGSVNNDLTSIHQTTGSLNTFTASAYVSFSLMTASIKDHEERVAYLEGIGGISGGNPLAQLHIFSASVNSFTSSINTTIKTKLDVEGVVSGSAQVNIYDLENFATVNDAIASDIGQKLFTSSFNEYTASQSTGSLVTSISNLNNATSSYETNGRGIVSGSSQITPLLPNGVVSGSAQVITANSITLGTHTTGNYIQTITGDTTNGLTVAGSGLESADVTLTLDQGIKTTSNPQFNSLGIGTAASTTAGEIRATGDITAYYSSDIRLKENIQPIENALQKIEMISGNTYDWKEGYEEIHSHKGNDVGVIAQEVEQILPQIVTNRDNGYKAVQYEKIIPLLIEAIKELSAKIDILENK